jgi:hypothetical protein
MIFRYPMSAHERRHGPRGYQDYRSYKPWLRDEFEFRCVYCLCRERWFPDGDANFSVDHIDPRHVAPERICDDNNLVYACCQCYAAKQDVRGILNPCAEPVGTHLSVGLDGAIDGLTPSGIDLIRICQLDRPKLTAFRRGMLALWSTLETQPGPEAAALRRRFFGFPANLPQLDALRPLGGNIRSRNLASSYFERHRRGELPPTY